MKKLFFMATMVAATLSANASIKNITYCTQAPDPTGEQEVSIDIYPDDYANPEIGPCAKVAFPLDVDNMDEDW